MCVYFWKVWLSKSLWGQGKSQFQYATVIIYTLYRMLIFIPTFLSTLLTHSLPYNGFRQYAVNRCMACYLCFIKLGEIFIPDLNFHRLIMLMHNLKGSLIMLFLLVLILLKAYLIINRNYINCTWLKCYFKICRFYSRFVCHLSFIMHCTYYV